ncbi:MAG: PaaX [Gammaproteobacteria bacterium]|nr:PaaX [Gammaproteobacteria bacterium]
MRTLIECAKVFEIEPAATRVAVGRLIKDQIIISVARGLYKIGPKGAQLVDQASKWSSIEDRLKQWDKRWLTVHTAHLGRSNKTSLRARERALRLNGFAELSQDLWCRPDNFHETIEETLARLTLAGLDCNAILMNVCYFPKQTTQRMSSLWPIKQIEDDYKQSIQKLESSIARLKLINIEDAIQESLMLGDTVIKQINSDPVLPYEMIDTNLRAQLIDSMCIYNNYGCQIWTDFLQNL